MVVRMVARVEVVVVQCSVKPVVEELHWTSMNKTYDNHTIASPEGQVMSPRKNHIKYVKQYSIEQDLVIPVNKRNYGIIHIRPNHVSMHMPGSLKDLMLLLLSLLLLKSKFSQTNNNGLNKNKVMIVKEVKVYIPVPFSINLLKFDTFVHDPIITFGCSVTG
jgi:hypothetical protein